MLTLSGTPYHLLCGVHDFTHSSYIHYRIYLRDYVYGLITGLFAWIRLTALSRTYCNDLQNDWSKVYKMIGQRVRESWIEVSL